MATSSILGGDRPPSQSSGRDTDALGPSDTSDSGSDIQGERGFDALDEGEVGGNRVDADSDTDAEGTGERGPAVQDRGIVEGADIAPDRVVTTDAGIDDTSAVDADARAADTYADEEADAVEDEDDDALDDDDRRAPPTIGEPRDPG